LPTLLLFAFKGEPADPRAWAHAVREAFPSADLDFEYGAGAAVVLPGSSLEQSLKAARALWFLVMGQNKAEAVQHVVFDATSTLPAARAARLDTEVVWLLDDTAARLIKNG
jgi:hypothetical protein